MANSFHMYS